MTRSWCAALVTLLFGIAFANPPEQWPVEPQQMEQEIWAHLEANQDLGFTSIERVKCNETDCEIRFTGPDPVNDLETLNRLVTDFMARLSREKHITIRQASSMYEEISPGVQGVVVRLSSRSPPGHTSPSQPDTSASKKK